MEPSLEMVAYCAEGAAEAEVGAPREANGLRRLPHSKFTQRPQAKNCGLIISQVRISTYKPMLKTFPLV